MPLPTDQELDAFRMQADPAADAVIEQLVAEKGPEEARRLFDLLIRNLDMPTGAFLPAADDFLAATRQLPDWADPGKVLVAHELFLDHGPKFLIALYYKSLPLLYLVADGARVLMHTARLTNEDRSLKIFARRVAETGQFLIDVMTPGELRPGGRGIQAIQKVRLIHAAIRHFMPADTWKEDEWGRPINQEHMAVTLMTFSVSLTETLDQFGIEEPAERRDAFFHTWKAIGHNLGIHPALLPEDEAQGKALLERILQRQAAESEAGRLLTASLIEFGREHFKNEKLKYTPESLIRFMIGIERARMLGVTFNYGCLAWILPEALRSYFRLGEKLEDKAKEPLRLLFDLLSRRITLAMVNYFNVYKGRPFSIPQQLKEAWFGVEERG